jgi:hypothetical protein
VKTCGDLDEVLEPYRELARAVLHQAVSDLEDPEERAGALSFLMDDWNLAVVQLRQMYLDLAGVSLSLFREKIKALPSYNSEGV